MAATTMTEAELGEWRAQREYLAIRDRHDLAPLGPAQLHILLTILEVYHFENRSTTFAELQRLTGNKSPNGITYHLKPLIQRGLIAMEERKGRTIRPLVRLEMFPEMFGQASKGDTA